MGHCHTRRSGNWGTGPGRSLERFPRLNWKAIRAARKAIKAARKMPQGIELPFNVPGLRVVIPTAGAGIKHPESQPISAAPRLSFWARVRAYLMKLFKRG